MIVDGTSIAADILRGVQNDVSRYGRPVRLSVLTAAPTPATKQYLDIKRRRATEVGIDMSITEVPEESSTSEVIERMEASVAEADGVVIQLPFPEHIDIEQVLARVPASHDVDVIGHEAVAAFERGDSLVVPPVVGAIAEIARRHDLSFQGRRVVIVGRGRLVGRPAAVWARQQGAEVVIVDVETPDVTEALRAADIIISGAGAPGLITPQSVQDGVAIFDAGTSEEGGRLVGDADPAVAEKASLFTPVPRGIGPVTVAKLLENLTTLALHRPS